MSLVNHQWAHLFYQQKMESSNRWTPLGGEVSTMPCFDSVATLAESLVEGQAASYQVDALWSA